MAAVRDSSLRSPAVDLSPAGWSEDARRLLPKLGPILLTACALSLWAYSLRDVEPAKMNDLGLVSVLPVSFFVALAALTASFCLCLRQAQRSTAVLLLHVLALIVMLYSVTALVEEVARFQVTWRHVGVTEYFTRTGQIDPTIDAYFNWPGFFIATAFLTETAGLSSAITIADWAPLFFNLLYLGPLLVILRTATKDDRLVWLAVWFFYSTNWTGTDYFSPQGLTYFLYLAVLAVVLRWLVGTPQEAAAEPSFWHRIGFVSRLPFLALTQPASTVGSIPAGETQLRPAQRVGIVAMTIVLLMAIVPTHQLTPFVVLASLTALVALRWCSARRLPVLMVVLIGAWVTLAASNFLEGHLGSLVGQVGDLGGTVESNVTNRVQGSAQHQVVVNVRLLLTAAVWGLALLGAALSLRRRRLAFAYALLGVAPFPLLVLQPYGGEMLLRAYFFSLPFAALFAASLFYSTRALARPRATTWAVGLLSAALLGGFLFARYGNERVDYFTPQEVKAVDRLYDTAKPGSLLLAGSVNFPWKFRDYEKFDYEVLTDLSGWRLMETPRPNTEAVLRSVGHLMETRAEKGAYLIITRSQKEGVDAYGISRPGSLDRFERAVTASPRFKLIYANKDARIFVLANRTFQPEGLAAHGRDSQDKRGDL